MSSEHGESRAALLASRWRYLFSSWSNRIGSAKHHQGLSGSGDAARLAASCCSSGVGGRRVEQPVRQSAANKT